MALTKIFEPIQMGNITIPNRVVRTAHGTALSRGELSEDLMAYHLERAKGGVGLSILELMCIHPSSPAGLSVFAPTLVESFKRFMEDIRPTGMRIFQQAWHGGHNGLPADGSPPWSASDIPNPMLGIVPKPMTQSMIDEIIEAYVTGAKLCEEGGLDGYEVHCAHGYLIQQFLSSNSNKREDDYGGPLENRMRFLLEILRAIRSEVSEDFVLGIRVAPDLTEGGIDVESNQQIVARLGSENLIDFLNISIGNYQSFTKIIGGMHEPMGYELPTSAPIAHASKTPSIVTGRFRTLEEADQVIRAGDADLVAFTRATIADPMLVAKTKAGRAEDVRPCIGCNQKCVGGVFGPYQRMGCAVNPAVGFEATLSEDLLEPAAEKKHVLIVGGGPAGMEAARIAALRGHKVTLCEAMKDLGGAINLAAKAPTRHGFGDITNWLERQVYELGVEVQLNTLIEAEDVRTMAPDAVIIATGSLPRMDGIQLSHPGIPAKGMERSNVLSSIDVFTSQTNDFGRMAVVVDDLGHFEAIAVAEYLLEKGTAVTFITRQISIAPKLEGAMMVSPAYERLCKQDFTIHTRTRLLEAGENVSKVVSIHGGPPLEVKADTVVFVSHNASVNDLVDELEGYDGTVVAVGSANSPRYLEDAIREGHLAARAL